MPAFKFYVSRRAYYDEVYVVEADSEDEARDIAMNGEINYDKDVVRTEFIDWADDEWYVEGKESIDPLTLW
jgi:hypothetical protein